MSNFLYYLAAFGIVLGVLIIVHEYGHYRVARWAGVKPWAIGCINGFWRVPLAKASSWACK